MAKKTIFAIFLMLTIVFSTWAPTVASTFPLEANTTSLTVSTPLKINNPMPKATTVDLQGAQKLTISVPAGQTVTKTIEKGVYKYKYAGCLGKTFTGALKYKGGEYTLSIKPCKMAKWVFVNQSSVTFTSELKGWMTYKISVAPGQTKTYQLVAGPYEFKNSCGGDAWTGKVKVGGNKAWRECS